MEHKRNCHENPTANLSRTDHRQPRPSAEIRRPNRTPQTYPATILQRARHDRRSLTPQDVLQLQRTIGNQAVLRMITAAEHPQGPVSGTVQRRVAVTSDNKDEGDHVTLNSIAFAKKWAGGSIQNYRDADFKSLNQREKIAFVGHGSPGQSGKYTGGQVASRLTGITRGMPDGDHNILFTSCDAGTREEDFDSVVDVVYDAIRWKWPGSTASVKGAIGPSVKTYDKRTGIPEWGVVGENVGIARDLQEALNDFYHVTITDPPQLDPYQSAKSLPGRAQYISKTYNDYFLNFVRLIRGELEDVPVALLNHIQESYPGILQYLDNGGISARPPIRIRQKYRRE